MWRSARASMSGPHQMRPRFAAAMVTATMAIGAIQSQPAESAEFSVHAISFNACGIVCNNGDSTYLSPAIARSILDNDASIVALQEICVNQANNVLALVGPAYTMRHAEVRLEERPGSWPASYCSLGNAILFKGGDFGGLTRYYTTYAGDPARRNAICHYTTVPTVLSEVCSTHLIQGMSQTRWR